MIIGKVEDERGWERATAYKIGQNYPVQDVLRWVIMFHFAIPK